MFYASNGIGKIPVDHPHGDEYLLKWVFEVGQGVTWGDLQHWADIKWPNRRKETEAPKFRWSFFRKVKRSVRYDPSTWELQTVHMLSQKMQVFMQTKDDELHNPYGMLNLEEKHAKDLRKARAK